MFGLGRKRCQVGTSCGGACISSKDACRVEFPKNLSENLGKFAEKIGHSIPTINSKQTDRDRHSHQADRESDYEAANKLQEQAKLMGQDNSPRVFNRWKTAEDMADKIREKVPGDIRVSAPTNHDIISLNHTVDGHNVSMHIRRNGDMDFTVDGEFKAGGISDKGTQVRIARSVSKMYDAVVSSLPEKFVLSNEPYKEDGKGGSRSKLYKRMGFSDVSSDGKQYAMISNGAVTPINSKEWMQNAYDQNFSEKVELPENTKIKLWFQILFPPETL